MSTDWNAARGAWGASERIATGVAFGQLQAATNARGDVIAV